MAMPGKLEDLEQKYGQRSRTTTRYDEGTGLTTKEGLMVGDVLH